MRNVFWLLLALAVVAPAQAANVNIDGLPAASSVSGTDLFECEQSGINRQCTGAQIKTYVGSGATTIALGSSALGTSAIASTACATLVTASATGVATTDTVTASFNGDPTAVTGYIPATAGGLAIYAYPTANNVNFKVCNPTSSSITPGAITLNWRVAR